MYLRSLATSACASVGLFLAACPGRAPAGSAVVAELDGNTLTVTDVQAYLDANLPAGDEAPQEAEAAPPHEQDEVKSRMFDNFIDEEVLALEARRQGIEVGEDEIDAWLRAGTEGATELPGNRARREIARRSLTVEKVRGKLIRDRVSVTPDEVDAYVSRHRETESTGRRLALRSYKLPSEAEARRLRPRIVRMKPRPGPDGGRDVTGGLESEPLEVELSSLPNEVRAAVVGLPAGGVSEPVAVQEAIYLFRVDAWLDPPRYDEDRLRQRAEEELLRVRHEEASRQLILELKRGIRLRIDAASLPFHYVPENPS